MNKRFTKIAFAWISAVLFLSLAAYGATTKKTKDDEGRYHTKDGELTYKIREDGTVDWLTYNGYRRYHSECHVCHGPDGLGSTFGPALAKSLEDMTYQEFAEVVANGRKEISVGNYRAMPGFAENPNVMCYVEDIYVYLKARSDDAIGRGRPRRKEAKTDAAAKSERACMSG